MNAKIRMIGLLVTAAVAMGLSETRGQSAVDTVPTGTRTFSKAAPAAVRSTPATDAPESNERLGIVVGESAANYDVIRWLDAVKQREMSRSGGGGRGRSYIQEIAQRIKNYGHYLRDPEKSDEEKVKLKQTLGLLLNRYFDEDINSRQAKITEIEQRVAKLKTQLEKRRAAKSELVQLQMKLIENEAAGLGFFGSGEASRGLRTMGMMRGRTGGRSPTPTARGTPDR